MTRHLAIVLALAAMTGCSEKKNAGGLPPAQEWGAEPGGAMPNGGPSAPMGKDMNNPHAGVDMSGGEGGDEAEPANPHAGVDMSGAGGGGTDVSKLGLAPPDPNRAVDPAHHVKGVILVHSKAAARVKSGTAVFVTVRRADATGAPTGTPLAVEKLTWDKDQLAFELNDEKAMVGGTPQLTGEVVVLAHYDQDGDAISKQPGDILGQMRVTIPADNVKIYLDDIVP